MESAQCKKKKTTKKNITLYFVNDVSFTLKFASKTLQNVKKGRPTILQKLGMGFM